MWCFLRRLISIPEVYQNLPDVGFIDRYLEGLASEQETPEKALIGLVLWLAQQHNQDKTILNERDPGSPWNTLGAWRLNDHHHCLLHLQTTGRDVVVSLRQDQERTLVQVEETAFTIADHRVQGDRVWGVLDGQTFQAKVIPNQDLYSVIYEGRTYQIRYQDPFAINISSDENEGHLVAPMPGRVTTVLVQEGEQVDKGMPLMILEAMKMEHTIRAPLAGQVEKLYFAQGDFVDEKEELISIVA